MRARTLVLVLPFLLPLDATARPGWATGTFVYANLCTQPEKGGLEGRRVVVRRSPNGNGVSYEAANGAVVRPLPADLLSIDEATKDIAFSIDAQDGPVVFRGVADTTVLAGTLTDRDGDHPLRLRRVLRSHEREDCRAVQPDPETTASNN